MVEGRSIITRQREHEVVAECHLPTLVTQPRRFNMDRAFLSSPSVAEEVETGCTSLIETLLAENGPALERLNATRTAA
ncbi:hypothetical protein [Brevundimonas denitrificans]|uniref:hypothetical protein n=1 Tax=Brevundimonas denitrificans TaxID=1443434 RepID=UPI00223B9336|nr:hypothetical protein [Brevundimonas denitrificans]